MDVNIIDSHAHIMLDSYASLPPVEPERVMEGFARYGVEQAWFSSADALVSNQTDDHRRSNDRMAELQQRFAPHFVAFATVNPRRAGEAARELERFQDASTGGFLTAANPDDGFAPIAGAVDVGSTCAASLGMIYSGRWDAARRAGEFLLRTLDTQGSAESFHCRFHSDGSPITDFPEEQAYVNIVRFEQPKQAYWYFGFAARILALAHRATGRQDFLEGALGYIDVFDRCHEDRWVHWANDKVAWASSALYQSTGDPLHLERVGRCFNPIVEAQRDDALWHWEAFFSNYDEQPRGITIELALEFAFLLHEIVSEIDSR